MLPARWKIATAVLLSLGLLAAGAFAFGLAGTEPQRREQGKRADGKPHAGKQAARELQGVWDVVSFEYKGVSRPAGPYAYAFDGGKFTFTTKEGKELYRGTVKLDPTRKPRWIDLTITAGEGKGESWLGLYELEGDSLKLAFDPGGTDRPKALRTSPDNDTKVWLYKRQKAK
jgi:uncharacterized protein (TIGR03067 family)